MRLWRLLAVFAVLALPDCRCDPPNADCPEIEQDEQGNHLVVEVWGDGSVCVDACPCTSGRLDLMLKPGRLVSLNPRPNGNGRLLQWSGAFHNIGDCLPDSSCVVEIGAKNEVRADFSQSTLPSE